MRPPRFTFGHALILLLVAGMALYARVLMPGELTGDDLSIHLAEMAGLADALRAFDLGLWNSSGNLGYPSAYYYQSLPQLTVVLLHLLTFSQVPLLLCFKGVLLVCLAGPAVTTAWALRRTGRPPSEAIAVAIALLLVGGRSRWGVGPDSLFTTGVFTQTFAFLWFGPALILGERFFKEGRDLGLALAMALATGLSHPFLGIVLGLYFVVRWYGGGNLAAQLGRLVLLGALLIVASAALWLPILVDYDSFGGFPARVAFEEGIRPTLFLPTWAKGELFDLQRLPVLTVAGLVGLGFAGARRYAILSLLSAALIMAGPSLGKTEDDLLPMIRLMAPMQWAHAVAAGITLAELGQRAWRWLAPTPNAPAPQAAKGKSRKPATPTRPRWQRDALLFALALFALIDGVPRLQAQWKKPDTSRNIRIGRDELDVLMAALGRQPPARVQVGVKLGTGNHFWAYLPYAYVRTPAITMWGGAALQSSTNFATLREDLDPLVFADLFDAPYILWKPAGRPAIAGAEVLANAGAYQLVRVPTRGFLTGAAILGKLPRGRLDRRRASLLWVRSEEARAGRHYEHAASNLAHNAAVLQLLRTEIAPSKVRLTVEVTAPGSAAARITYHPRWRATLDGAPLPLGRVTPDLLAFELPIGHHVVELRFVRPAWHYGLYGLTALLLAGAFVWDRRRARRAPDA